MSMSETGISNLNMGSRKIRRMDESISNVMRLVRNTRFERIIRQEKGYVPKKLNELRKKHKVALEEDFQFTVDEYNNGEYTLISGNGSIMNIYTVEFSKLQCNCLLECDECKICVHSVRCDCYDSTIKNSLCKHVHFIAMKRSQQEVECEQAEHVMDDLDNDPLQEKSIFLSQSKPPT